MNIFKKFFSKKEEVIEEEVVVKESTIVEKLQQYQATEQDMKLFHLVEDLIARGEYEVGKGEDNITKWYRKDLKGRDGRTYSFMKYFKVKVGGKWFRISNSSSAWMYNREGCYYLLNREVFSSAEVRNLICSRWYSLLSEKAIQEYYLRNKEIKQREDALRLKQTEECIKFLEGE